MGDRNGGKKHLAPVEATEPLASPRAGPEVIDDEFAREKLFVIEDELVRDMAPSSKLDPREFLR